MHPQLAGLLAPNLDRSPCLCLLLEDRDRLMLVDTGFGTRDMKDLTRLGPGRILLNVLPRPEETAVRQIQAMGFRGDDVTDIICTHLDRDHAGGLSDFPWANVHVLEAERRAALLPPTGREKERYRAQHFKHQPKWVTYEKEGVGEWFGIECLRPPELPHEIILVPLPGHTRGHCGVAVYGEEGWVLHCGDAYYIKEELRSGGRAPLGVRGFRAIAHIDMLSAMEQIAHLQRLMAERPDVKMLASHDQFEYRNLFGKPLE
jgi:glyoxylase-like metal-dependent hydrolase (beta-lactamase superfamily II)